MKRLVGTIWADVTQSAVTTSRQAELIWTMLKQDRLLENTMKRTNTLCALLLMVMLMPVVVEAGCVRQATANCTVMTGMKTCSATLMCSAAPLISYWVLSPNSGSLNVTSCTPSNTISFNAVTWTLVAKANTSSSATRQCSWNWRTLNSYTMGTTSITTADGLPVELMEFSVEE